MCLEEFARSLAVQRLFFVSFVGFRVYTVFTVVMVQSGIGPGTFKTRLYRKLEKLSKTNCTIKDKLPLIILLFFIFCFSFYLSNA